METRLSRRTNWPLISMLLPGLAALAVFSYLPMGGIFIAFKNINYAKGLWGSDWIGLKNFEFFFKTPDAFTIMRNTVLYNLAFIVLDVAIPVAVAILLDGLKRKKSARVYQAILFLPYFFSWIVISQLGFAFLSMDMGFLNTGLMKALGKDAVNWYTEAKLWPFIIVLVHTWKYAGYNSIIYFAALSGIDPGYFEAAAIDGASPLKIVRHITLPLLSPTVLVLVTLAIGRIFFGEFGLFFQVPRNMGALFPTTNVFETYVYRTLINIGNIGMSAAADLYKGAVGFILVLVTDRIVHRIDPEKSLL
jgi:putative aldouronate transport system permease protein